MAKKHVQTLDFADVLSNPEHAGEIKAPIQVAIDGAKFELPVNLANMAREGFIFLTKGEGKFAAMEPDISARFDAPDCYVISNAPEAPADGSDGYKALREVLAVAYPGFRESKDFIAAQEKIQAEDRDAIPYNAALMIVANATRAVRRAIGFMYRAWKTRTEQKNAERETESPDEYMRDTVRKNLKAMTAPRSKHPEADKRKARFWIGCIDAVLSNPRAFDEIVAKVQLGMQLSTAQKPDKSAQQPGETVKWTAEQIAAANAAAAAVAPKAPEIEKTPTTPEQVAP